MKYRPFGKLDWGASVLGFGAMRLPVIDNQAGHIDEAEAEKMIRYAIDCGVNYVDTAYPYHEGRSEPFLGRVLKQGYREKVKLATKQPTWYIKKAEDFDRYLDEQLARLQTEHIDFYLLHGLNHRYWPILRDMGVLKWAEGAMVDGRIHYLGFSFHDDFPVFKEIIDGYDNWTFCQIQYNYMDIEYQAGTQGLEYAADKGLAVVIMEPLRGGQLAKNPPEEVTRLWASAPQVRTPADWALQWVWNHAEVSVVLSGMSAMQHVEENLASADRASEPGTLAPEDLRIVDQVRETYRKLRPIPCTSCKYCMPCPNGVNISRTFELYNDAHTYGDLRRARFLYHGPFGLRPAERADNCVECGECQEVCPQEIPIIEWLAKAHELLGPKENP
jgi:hypothetical protein